MVVVRKCLFGTPKCFVKYLIPLMLSLKFCVTCVRFMRTAYFPIGRKIMSCFLCGQIHGMRILKSLQMTKNLWHFFLNILLFSFLWRSCSWCRSNKGGEGAWQEVSSESLMHHCPAWLYLDCLKGYFNSCHCHEIPRQCHTKEDTKNGRILMLLRCSEVLGSPGFRPEFIYFFSFHPHCQ